MKLVHFLTLLLTLSVSSTPALGIAKNGHRPRPRDELALFPGGRPSPEFGWLPGDADFPDERRALGKLLVGFSDMLKMATVACILFDPNEQVYLRYFGERNNHHPALVQSIICNVAGIERPNACTLTSILGMNLQFSPKYYRLKIMAGYNDVIPRGEQQAPHGDGSAATTYHELGTSWGIGTDDERAVMSVWKRGTDAPSIAEIMEKRGCNNLGVLDSGLMTTLGAHLSHEMMHWRYLVRSNANAAEYDAVIPREIFDEDDPDDGDEREFIGDYDTDDYSDRPPMPADGYGPVNTVMLVGHDEKDSFQNAENYRWYVVSKLWQFICQREFGEQTEGSRDDTMIPAGSDGQVPYPNEVLAAPPQNPPPQQPAPAPPKT